MCSHDNGYDVVHQSIHEELFRHVITTIGIFKSQVILVRCVEEIEALLLPTSGTAFCPTSCVSFVCVCVRVRVRLFVCVPYHENKEVEGRRKKEHTVNRELHAFCCKAVNSVQFAGRKFDGRAD